MYSYIYLNVHTHTHIAAHPQTGAQSRVSPDPEYPSLCVCICPPSFNSLCRALGDVNLKTFVIADPEILVCACACV